MRTALAIMTSAAAIGLAGGAWAKLPSPPADKAAAAAEAKNKAAHGEKVAAYKLCQRQDRLAQQYLKSDKGNGKKPVETPACADPGPYTPLPPTADAGNAPGTPATAGASAKPAAPAASPAPAPAAAAPAAAPAPAQK